MWNVREAQRRLLQMTPAQWREVLRKFNETR